MLIVVIGLGAAARLYRLHALPPGLHTDEAFYALDALAVIDGARPIYFPANNGREPLFIYLLSVSLSILGRSALAVRLPAALLGVLTLAAAYAMIRALFNRRAALIATAILAGTFWAVAFSRIGLRVSSLPVIACLMIACAALGWRRRHMPLVAAGGALFGLLFYTYVSARLAPLALFAWLVFWYSAARPTFPPIRWLAAFLLPALLVAAPLGLYALREPQIYFGRIEQVAIVTGEGGWGALINNLMAVGGMFFWRGDLNARHNLPGRPVFDPLLALAFAAGLALAAWRVVGRRDRAAALALAWTLVMLAPTVFSNLAPHFLRSLGALPMAVVFPALALERVWVRNWRGLGRPTVVAAVLLSGALTVRDYFGPYAADPNTAYYFQSAVRTLAEDVGDYRAGPQRSVFLDKRLWDFAAARFLIPQGDDLIVYLPGERLSPPATGQARLIAATRDDLPPALRALPAGSLIRAAAGPLYRDDGPFEPFALYASYSAAPRPPAPGAPVAEFGPGLSLLDARASIESGALRVELIWAARGQIGETYHAFVHLRDGEQVAAQADGPAGGELFPTALWRAGDWIAEARKIDLPAATIEPRWRLWVGLYLPATLERLRTPDGLDAVAIPLP